MRIGVSTWLWTSPLTTAEAERLVPLIARMGYDCVELPLEDVAAVDAARVLRVVSDCGITASVCGVFGPGRDLTNADPRVRAATRDYLRRCLDLAATVRAGFVAGPLYAQVGKRRPLPENERRAEWALAVEEIRGVCEDAAQRGLCIAIEPINRFETDLCNSVADAVRMARDVGHPAARVMCDSFHMTIEEADLEAAVRSAGELLVHVQVSENHRGVPGTGLTDWAAFARGLRAIEYRGLVVLESFTPENRDLAGAVCIWNRRTRTQDEFAERGLEFLRRTFT
jgi:D-psicose/D-tagatose/L-ribulose 3-epimerase